MLSLSQLEIFFTLILIICWRNHRHRVSYQLKWERNISKRFACVSLIFGFNL